MHTAFLALIWLCFSVLVVLVSLAVGGLVYVAVLIKRSGFSEMFRRLGNRRR